MRNPTPPPRVPPQLFKLVKDCADALVRDMETTFVTTATLPILSCQQKTVHYALCEAVRFGMIIGRLLPIQDAADHAGALNLWAKAAWDECLENSADQKRAGQ